MTKVSKKHVKPAVETPVVETARAASRRTVLVAGLGTSPAVITETVWELGLKGDLPDEVVVLTTTRGRDQLKRELMESTPKNGRSIWEQLLDALQKRGVEVAALRNAVEGGLKIKVFESYDGLQLSDLRTREENLAVGDKMLETLYEYKRSGWRVVASIAGGRKTMSALLMSCMSLAAEEGDRVYHVLVDPQYERYMEPPYYFAGQGKKHVPMDPKTKAVQGDSVRSSDIKVELFDVPFVLAREWYWKAYYKDVPRYAALISDCNQAAKEPNIVIDLKQGKVTIDGIDMELNPREVAFFQFWMQGEMDSAGMVNAFGLLRNVMKRPDFDLKTSWLKTLEKEKDGWLKNFDDSNVRTLKHDVREKMKAHGVNAATVIRRTKTEVAPLDLKKIKWVGQKIAVEKLKDFCNTP